MRDVADACVTWPLKSSCRGCIVVRLHASHQRGRLGLWLLALCGCYPVNPVFPLGEGESSSSGSTAATTVGGSSSGAAVTTGIVAPGTSSSGSSGAASTSTGSTTEAQTFLIGTDGPTGGLDCDTLTQDCPPGQKCTFYAYGGGSWNATKCVPVMENPAGLGDACFVVENGVSGIDNCEKGAMCWDTDAENMGTCIPLCAGAWDALVCPSGYAVGYARAGICLCFEDCDPLAQDCPDGELCGGTGGGFLCIYDASGEEGQAHDPCEYLEACDPGLQCVDSTSAVECGKNFWGCCEPFCDLTEPNTCPGQGQLCNPYFEEGTAPAGLEHIGYCAVPS